MLDLSNSHSNGISRLLYILPAERRQSSVGTVLSEAVQGFGSATSSLVAVHIPDEVTKDDKDHEEKEKDGEKNSD